MEEINYLNRLNSFNRTNLTKYDYLHYVTFHKDLKSIFDQFIRVNANVLDIGCGNKPYAEYILKITKNLSPQSYIGCDVVQSSEQKVDILCDATNIPLNSDSFDVVLCAQVLEHVFDHKALISEAYRLLKDDGIFIVSAPFIWEHHEEPFDFYRFTRFGFQKLLLDSGFKIEYYCANGGQWATLGLMLNMIVKTPVKVKYVFVRKILSLFRICVFIISNFIFGLLNKIFDKSDKLTLNHIFVCRK